MKKVIYGTTALLAAGMFAAAAEAATPLKLTVGGYLNAFMGYTNLSEKEMGDRVNKFAIGTDGEIVFTAETKLDNGIKVGAIAEVVIGSVDATGNQRWLDDVYTYAETKYGKVELGATDNVAKKLHNGAPEVGPLDTIKIANWLGVIPAVSLDSTTIKFGGNSKKISYFSPKFYGFQLGASYIPGAARFGAFQITHNGAQPSGVLKANNAFSNAYAISGAYEGKFSGVTVGADVAYGSVGFRNNLFKKNQEQYSFGADVSFSGFTVGAGYSFYDWNLNRKNNDQSFELGVGYENGPYAVSANYFFSKIGKYMGTEMSKFQKYQVSGKYKLGAGVDAFATFAYLDLNDRAATGYEDLNKVWTVVTGLALTF